MENKILLFRLRAEGVRRKRDHKQTPLDLITEQARTRYLERVDRIRHASITSLSPIPYNAWGIAPTE